MRRPFYTDKDVKAMLDGKKPFEYMLGTSDVADLAEDHRMVRRDLHNLIIQIQHDNHQDRSRELASVLSEKYGWRSA